jgi:hypothetical protein
VIAFAVNLGVESKRLLQREEEDPPTVTAEKCHWRKRLTSAETESDLWLTVDGAESAYTAARATALNLRDRGLPALATLSSDAALRDLWLSGRGPGLTRVERLLNLAVLTSQIGPAEEAEAAVRVLKAMCESDPMPVVINYLREIGAS